MSAPMGKQSIRCSVKSCSYHAKSQDVCDLSCIQVAAKPGGNTGLPDGESMCASYRHG